MFPGSGTVVVVVVVWLQGSLQQAGALGALVFAHGPEQLDGLTVDQLPEVLEGDVLAALDAHQLQDLTQALFTLHRLGDCRHLFGDHGLELGGVHGRTIVCSFVKLSGQRVDGQLQV